MGLEDKIRNMELSKNARLRAENLWSEKRYQNLCHSIKRFLVINKFALFLIL